MLECETLAGVKARPRNQKIECRKAPSKARPQRALSFLRLDDEVCVITVGSTAASASGGYPDLGLLGASVIGPAALLHAGPLGARPDIGLFR